MTGEQWKPRPLGRGVSFTGVGAIIMPGVTLGRHCIIGAGSVVTHDVPAWHVAAGNPARVLREVPMRKDHATP